MARKYTRDNRGRFASGGGGATARGGRLRTASGNKRATQTMKAQGAGGAGVMKGAIKRDAGAMAKRSAPAKPAPKVRTDIGAVKERRQRALAPKNATYLSQKLNMRSAVVKSAANAIYNRQARGAKELFGGKNVPTEILKSPIGIMPFTAKAGAPRPTNKDRALANLEAATKRVRSGRRGRR